MTSASARGFLRWGVHHQTTESRGANQEARTSDPFPSRTSSPRHSPLATPTSKRTARRSGTALPVKQSYSIDSRILTQRVKFQNRFHDPGLSMGRTDETDESRCQDIGGPQCKTAWGTPRLLVPCHTPGSSGPLMTTSACRGRRSSCPPVLSMIAQSPVAVVWFQGGARQDEQLGKMR